MPSKSIKQFLHRPTNRVLLKCAHQFEPFRSYHNGACKTGDPSNSMSALRGIGYITLPSNSIIYTAVQYSKCSSPPHVVRQPNLHPRDCPHRRLIDSPHRHLIELKMMTSLVPLQQTKSGVFNESGAVKYDRGLSRHQLSISNLSFRRVSKGILRTKT